MASLPTPGQKDAKGKDKDTLSLPATLLYRLGLPLTTSAIYFYSPATALFTPIVAAPTAILLYQRTRLPPSKRPGSLEHGIWTWLGAATIAPAASMIVQSVLSYGAATLIFREQRDEYITELMRAPDEVRSLPLDLISKRTSMAQSWPYLAYLTLFAFAMAGLPEELSKYSILSLLQRYSATPLTANDYVFYARAIGLGFSFFESLAFIYVSATTESTAMMFTTAAERLLYGTAAHVLTAVLSATLMARDSVAEGKHEKRSWWQIIGPSTLYHGAGNALLFAACAWDGHPGWVHPDTLGKYVKYVFGPVAVMTGLGMHVAREMRQLGVIWRFV